MSSRLLTICVTGLLVLFFPAIYCRDNIITKRTGYFVFPKVDSFGSPISQKGDVYVQYFSEKSHSEEYMRIRMLDENWSKCFQIIAVVEQKSLIPLVEDMHNIKIITKEHLKINPKYGQSGISGHYLISSKRDLIFRGFDNDNVTELMTILNRRYRNIKFSASSLFNEKDVFQTPWMKEWRATFPRSNIIIGALFTSICNTCYSGRIVAMLNDFHNKFGSMIEIRAILGSDFAIHDIPALKSQLGIEFVLEIAPKSIIEKWDPLIDAYGKNSVTDIVFILDQDGNIIQTFTRDCNCIDLLEKSIHQVLQFEMEGSDHE